MERPTVEPAQRPDDAGLDAADVARREPVAANRPIERAASTESSIVVSDCGCGGGDGVPCSCSHGPQLVYAFGRIGHDFGSEARRDSFSQAGLEDPDDPKALVAYLKERPPAAGGVIFTLEQESTAVYALEPEGPFAGHVYQQLLDLLSGQGDESVERVSIPGQISGRAHLLNGQAVPIIRPETRGIWGWSTQALIAAVLGDVPAGKGAAASEKRKALAADLGNFLDRVYYEIRNLGIAPQDRAINFAATNAFQVERVYRQAARAELKLQGIDVARSPLCRPDSDCWDVKLAFFHPSRRLDQAREVYRFTVDVSDVVPVTVGQVRHWHEY